MGIKEVKFCNWLLGNKEENDVGLEVMASIEEVGPVSSFKRPPGNNEEVANTDEVVCAPVENCKPSLANNEDCGLGLVVGIEMDGLIGVENGNMSSGESSTLDIALVSKSWKIMFVCAA